MKKTTTFRLFLLMHGFALVGCSRSQSPAPAVETSAAAPPQRAKSAGEALDSLDTRAAVPLLPMMANHQKQNMRDHLMVVQEIIAALASDDFAGIERASGRIGSSDHMGRMCNHMGAAAPGFTEQALRFHHVADGITQAARSHDRIAVLSALGATLQNCTSCHSTWRQQVVDEPTWERLTSSPPAVGSSAR